MKIKSLLAGMACLLGVASQAHAINFLDDMIYSVKCAGATDTEACKAQAQKNFEDYQKTKAGTPASANMRVPDEGVNDHNYRERCEQASATGPVDIDIAYNRAMNKYKFETPEELARMRDVRPGFNHARVPGVRYDISTTVNFPGYPKEARGFVTLVLSKSENGRGTDMKVQYCQTTSDLEPNPYFNDPVFWSNVAAGFKSLVR